MHPTSGAVPVFNSGSDQSRWMPFKRVAVHLKCAIISIMDAEQSTDKLDDRLEEEGAALEKLKGSLAENKEASKELEKSLDELEEATEKLVQKSGLP
jgi:prefoldin subunit 5